jgi:hypothetical protein
MRTVLFNCLASLSLLLLGGCEKKTETMLDRLQVEPVVNLATGVLLRENLLMAAQLEADGSISGMTDKQAFETPDQFNSFTTLYLSSGPSNPKQMKVNGALFFYESQGSTLPVLNCSENHGRTWNTFTPVITGGGPEQWRISDYVYHNPTTLFILSTRGEHSSWYDTTKFYAMLYKVNPKTRTGELVSSIENYKAQGIYFFNDEVGWMTLSKSVRVSYNYFESHNTYVARTTDGGRTWSEPVLVNREHLYNLAAGSDQTVFLYTGPTTTYEDNGYFSRDGGRTWQRSNSHFAFYDVAYASSQTLYALTGGTLEKSINGGESWTTLQEFGQTFHGASRLDFINEKQGIAYTHRDRVMSFTNDGGLTWKLLLYPFRYVME